MPLGIMFAKVGQLTDMFANSRCFFSELREIVDERFIKRLAYLWYGFDLISLMISPKYFNKYFKRDLFATFITSKWAF